MDDAQPTTPSSDAVAARTSAALRDLQSLAQSVSTARRERMSQLEADLTGRLDAIADALAEQRSSVNETSEEAARSQAELDAGRAEFEAGRAEFEAREQQLTEREKQCGEEDRRQQQRARELEERELELDRRAADLAERNSELETTKTEHEASAAAESRAELEDLTQRGIELQELLAAAELERDEANARAVGLVECETQREAARLALVSERDQLASNLAAAREDTSAAVANAALTAELEELKQKFSLALEDVQRFRTRVASLEQELAERPATAETDSAELVALRAERDALAERVTELENREPLSTSANDGQELSDLQRRFELAVEDVRELKTKNARLESQLAAPRQPAHSSGDASAMDWESQKRRLLASLEGDDAAPIQEKERITIANTIQITDAVVAEKDLLIAELKTQLVAQAEAPVANQVAQERATNELLDADEIIATHRKKAAEHEKESESKLRTFEMEMSVDRAKMARLKVELDQLRVELEAARKALPGGSIGSVPKRRWLSKLGLSGEEAE